MVFHEIYGSYFQVVSAILTRAVAGELSPTSLEKIVAEQAFAESVLTIPAALKSKEWPLLDTSTTTPLKHKPTRPLTTLQRRWLKALLQDPRIALFTPSVAGLEDVEPLFAADTFVYFDRYEDGDPYENPQYIAHFKTILQALREKRRLEVSFTGHRMATHGWVCVPLRLEYSPKDDKFRLLVTKDSAINVARITHCTLGEAYDEREVFSPKTRRKALVLELTDHRNALERAMLHFSHLEKETTRLGGERYQITLRYDIKDETELLIRVLSFGPMLRVLSPQSFITQIKARLEKQRALASSSAML